MYKEKEIISQGIGGKQDVLELYMDYAGQDQCFGTYEKFCDFFEQMTASGAMVRLDQSISPEVGIISYGTHVSEGLIDLGIAEGTAQEISDSIIEMGKKMKDYWDFLLNGIDLNLIDSGLSKDGSPKYQWIHRITAKEIAFQHILRLGGSSIETIGNEVLTTLASNYPELAILQTFSNSLLKTREDIDILGIVFASIITNNPNTENKANAFIRILQTLKENTHELMNQIYNEEFRNADKSLLKDYTKLVQYVVSMYVGVSKYLVEKLKLQSIDTTE